MAARPPAGPYQPPPGFTQQQKEGEEPQSPSSSKPRNQGFSPSTQGGSPGWTHGQGVPEDDRKQGPRPVHTALGTGKINRNAIKATHTFCVCPAVTLPGPSPFPGFPEGVALLGPSTPGSWYGLLLASPDPCRPHAPDRCMANSTCRATDSASEASGHQHHLGT